MSRPRVCIVADALCDERPRGLARYTRGLCAALIEHGGVDLEVVTHVAPAPAVALPPVRHHRLAARREIIREHVELPRLLVRRGADVLHAPANRGLPLRASAATVVTRHDVIERTSAPASPAPLRSRLRMLYADEVAMRRATVVATVSETSARDIARQWPGCAGRTVVVGEGVEARFFTAAPTAERERVRRRFELPRDFVLYVGGFEPRKDVATLVAAVAACGVSDVDLALAGATGPWREGIRGAVTAAGLGSRVRVLDFVDDQDLPVLYATARAFVYPSRYEGFGLPVVEAMAAGTPTIVSGGGALPEIAGGAARVVPVGDVTAFAAALEQVLTDPRAAQTLVEQGRRRADELRWERIAPRYVSLYRRLAGAGAAPTAAQPVLA